MMIKLLFATLLMSAAAHGKAPPAPVDLNRASVEELMQLPGVGRTRAESIVRQRATRPYRRTADVMRIKGFGRRTFARLKPFLSVTPGDIATGVAPSTTASAAATAAGKPATSAPTASTLPSPRK
jgi:competence protein ComEA